MIDFNKKIYNSDKFRSPAINFLNTGSYCNYPKGTTEYYNFWEEEATRCLEGYTADDGDYITGYNYFYLNYCPIQRIVYEKQIDGSTKRLRKTSFPDFYDYDYYFFQAVQEAEQLGKHLCVTKSRRKGYEQPYSELVATPNGFVTMGSVQVGDEVITPYGTNTKVKEVFEQGYKDVYEVVLHDGRKVKCGKHHLWRVYRRGTKGDSGDGYSVMTTWDLIQKGLYNITGKYRVYKYYLEPIEEVPFEEKELLIHPYILGCLLGDGTINKKGRSIKISTADKEIVDEFERILGEDYELKRDLSCYNYRIVYKKRFDKIICSQFENGKFGVNPLSRYISELGLNCKCDEKFIPKDYIYSSIEQRYELVKGLMDTDGTISSDGSMMFANTSKQLVDDLALILRSLGIRCEIGLYKKDECKLLYRLYIRSNKNLFKLSRKSSRVRTDKKLWNKVAIIEINRLDYQEQCKCILLEDNRHMYLTRDYIPTHNSYKTASMMCRNFFLIPNSKSYVFASNKQYLTEDGNLTKAWDYMDFIDENTAWGKKRQVANTAMRRRASLLVTDNFGNKIEVGYKSEIMGVSVKDNPNNVRGKAAKLILWEEGGSFKELKAAWEIARPSVEQDGVAFGLMCLFGCVCAGTKVWTKTGNCINIEDLSKEDGIVGWNTYSAVLQDIKHLNPPSKKECVQITTNSGRTIRCSKDHPMLWSFPSLTRRVPGKRAENEHMKKWVWKHAGDCKVGEQLGVINEIPFFGDNKMWEPRLIGWLIGDGSYGKDKTPRLSNCDDDITSQVFKNFDTAIEKQYITKTGKNYYEIRIKGICQQLRKLGIYGQTKKAKRLPINIHTYTREDLAELIGGLFDTDGTIYITKKGNVKINITQCQSEILTEIADVLLQFGVQSKIIEIKTKGREHTYNNKQIIDRNNYFRLEINDITSAANFAKNFHFTVGYKQAALDLIEILTQTHIAKHHKYLCGIHAERIVKIEDIGSQTVYNLMADGYHNYIANGFVTHNTGGDEGDNVAGLREIFYDPEAYNCLSFPNIWDEGTVDKPCGFFVPQHTNLDIRDKDGNRIYMDKDGNTYHEKAKEFILNLREKELKNAKDSQQIDRYVAEHAETPAEAFTELSGNIFPKKELQKQLSYIRTNKKLANAKQVGFLTENKDGTLTWNISKVANDITQYPLPKMADPTGAIVIWEHPIIDAPYGLYCAGCLIPGEKVVTDRGLVKVEDVDFTCKLLNRNGKFVKIKNLQRYKKVNEPIYKIRTSHTYTTTTFTQEHPILVSDQYITACKTIAPSKFNFNFVKAKDLKEGQWTIVPNQYLEENNMPLYYLWKNNSRIDRRINNPLLNTEFWWFVGLWLGDGYCVGKSKVNVVFNKSDVGYIERFKSFVDKVLHRKCFEKTGPGIIDICFSCKELNEWLTTHFGKYANGKYIPEWAKYLSQQYKCALLQGYLDSDGCVYQSGKYYITDYVSINIKLLQDIQDILFSLGLISNISRLRDRTEHYICGKLSNVQAAYQLRMAYHDTVLFKELVNHPDRKLDKVKTSKTRTRPKDGCFFSNDLKYIYFKIRSIEQSTYTGWVYNFECDTHTFACRHIMTHNCDPYDQNQSGTNSLGSCIIYKRFQNFESYSDIIVAEYTGRPKTAEEFYENVRKLLKYYNAKAMVENQNTGIFAYFNNKHCNYLLADQPDIIRDITNNSKVNRGKGCHMTKEIKLWGEGAIKEWLEEDIGNGKLRLNTILSEPLLEELIKYNDKANCDRVMALMQLMIYKEQLYNYQVKKKEDIEKKMTLFNGPLFKYKDDSYTFMPLNNNSTTFMFTN